jgi:beta-galactosidase
MSEADSSTCDWENPHVFQRNKLPPRAYFLPETSLSLNGQWDFNYVLSPLLAPEVSKDKKSDKASEPVEWTKIAVPGHWQLQGHGSPNYTNTIFPFPCDPPHVPSQNPTGTYRRSFNVPPDWDPSAQLRLRFDGVDCAYHLWVNGHEVGYAQGSRNPSEFDVSQFVDRKAKNDLVVRVYQWSDGSYIEDQDQWWLSGISSFQSQGIDWKLTIFQEFSATLTYLHSPPRRESKTSLRKLSSMNPTRTLF